MTIQPSEPTSGSLDGNGAADHDEPYVFGRRPREAAPFPFTVRQYAHLLLVKASLQAQSNREFVRS